MTDRVRWVDAGFPPHPLQAEYAKKSALHPFGDMVLVWVNEGDLTLLGTKMDATPWPDTTDPTRRPNSEPSPPPRIRLAEGEFPPLPEYMRQTNRRKTLFGSVALHRAAFLAIACGFVGGFLSELVGMLF